jgi:hypothetical protein
LVQIKISFKQLIFFIIIPSITIFAITFGDATLKINLIYVYVILLETYFLLIGLLLPQRIIAKYFVRNKLTNEKINISHIKTLHLICFFIILPELYILKYSNPRLGLYYTIIAFILIIVVYSIYERKKKITLGQSKRLRE